MIGLKHKFSIRTVLILRMAIVLLVTLAVIGFYSVRQIKLAGDRLSERVIRQTSNLIDERTGALLDKAESQAKLVSAILRPELSPLRDSPINSGSFQEIAPELTEVARANPEFGVITLVLERTGESVVINQSSSGSLTIDTTEIVATGQQVKKTYAPFGDKLQEISQSTTLPDDPRLTDAYQLCKASKNTIWTDTVVLQNSEGHSVLGVTCATPVVSSSGLLRGVVTISFTLSEMTRFMDSLVVGDHGYAFLIQYDENGKARVIAGGPEQESVLEAAPDRLGMETKDSDNPELHQMVQLIDDFPLVSPGQVEQVRFNTAGHSYVGGFQILDGTNRPEWLLCVIAPRSDFFVTTNQAMMFFLTAAFLAICVGILVSYLVAERVAQPLRRLARETGKITSLEFDDSPVVVSDIREISQLSDSVQTMKSGLRSMEKLVPTEYARHLIQTGQEAKLGGERRRITTSFGDIVGFTRLSNELPPEQLVQVLGEYLEVLSNEVILSDGTLDKFNGDDVMAFWGAPSHTNDHAFLAVDCALRSLDAIDALHKEWKEDNLPMLSACFGVETGDVIVGNVGNKLRMNYTVIGDSVNMASRLQGLNKFFGTRILVGHQAYTESNKLILYRYLDRVSVFGKDDYDDIYEPIALKETATDKEKLLAQLYNTAMESYQRKHWSKAAKQFESVLLNFPEDKPSQLMLSRCEGFEQKPPTEDWNGATDIGWK